MSTHVTAFLTPPSTLVCARTWQQSQLDLDATLALGRGRRRCFTPASSHAAIPKAIHGVCPWGGALWWSAVPSFLLLCRGHVTETLGSQAWLDVDQQTASMQQGHVKTWKILPQPPVPYLGCNKAVKREHHNVCALGARSRVLPLALPLSSRPYVWLPIEGMARRPLTGCFSVVEACRDL